ncbi:MAG: hypothetical protein DHS20C17_20350 [Cyclobacteriaceae bacterium]|nr:MAG: hypothetical protein DHS20C17_20350 [Cyclobacteriaceae bacterium]
METILEKIKDLNKLVVEGKAMEAFEKYYHDDVVMQENEDQPTKGKSANRQREQEFFDSITEFRSSIPLRITVGEGTSMVEWHYDFTHKDWGERNYQQVSVQQWQDGKIINEKFYYHG